MLTIASSRFRQRFHLRLYASSQFVRLALVQDLSCPSLASSKLTLASLPDPLRLCALHDGQACNSRSHQVHPARWAEIQHRLLSNWCVRVDSISSHNRLVLISPAHIHLLFFHYRHRKRYDRSVGTFSYLRFVHHADFCPPALSKSSTPKVQASGHLLIEPGFDVSEVAEAVVFMASRSLDTNVANMTIMATTMASPSLPRCYWSKPSSSLHGFSSLPAHQTARC
jgi:hypothetical protein